MILRLVCSMPTYNADGETRLSTVEIDNTQPVHMLIKKICDNWHSHNNSVVEMKPEYINLYKANIPSNPLETFSERRAASMSECRNQSMGIATAISYYFPSAEPETIHILVECTGRILFCHIYDELTGTQMPQIFSVMVRKNAQVVHLREAVENVRPDRLAGLLQTNVQLYHAMVRMNKGTMDSPFVLEDHQLMMDAAQWSDYISDADLQMDGILHVVIAINARPALKYNASTQSTANRLKQMMLVASAPSPVAQQLHYQAVQGDLTGRVLDDHTMRDAGIPPIGLLYPPFGDFLDTVYGGREVDYTKLTITKDNVSVFADGMTGFFPDQASRQDRGLFDLDKIFDHNIWWRRWWGHTALPDGHITTQDGFPCTVVVFQNNEFNDTAQVPQMQGLGRIAKMHAETLSDFQTIYDKFRMPSLVITVVGDAVTFYAVLLLDTQYRMLSLTSTLSCVPAAGDGRDRETLSLAFMAANTLTTRIMHDINEAAGKLRQLPCIPVEERRLPGITSLKRSEGEGRLTFHINGRHAQQQDDRELYIATEDRSNKTLIIKFTKHYCLALHNLCAAANHAPKVLAYELLPGGWHAVTMEYIEHAPSLDDAVTRWGAESMKYAVDGLRKLVAEFHAAGYVHGDLRGANILADQTNFWLIDFDSGGKRGEAKYPSLSLNEQVLKGRTVQTDLMIRKEGDDAVLAETFAILKLAP